MIPLSLASSTKIISCKYFGGVLFITLWTVLSKVDHASLWKHIMMDVVGKSVGYFVAWQLRRRRVEIRYS